MYFVLFGFGSWSFNLFALVLNWGVPHGGGCVAEQRCLSPSGQEIETDSTLQRHTPSDPLPLIMTHC